MSCLAAHEAVAQVNQLLSAGTASGCLPEHAQLLLRAATNNKQVPHLALGITHSFESIAAGMSRLSTLRAGWLPLHPRMDRSQVFHRSRL